MISSLSKLSSILIDINSQLWAWVILNWVQIPAAANELFFCCGSKRKSWLSRSSTVAHHDHSLNQLQSLVAEFWSHTLDENGNFVSKEILEINFHQTQNGYYLSMIRRGLMRWKCQSNPYSLLTVYNEFVTSSAELALDQYAAFASANFPPVFGRFYRSKLRGAGQVKATETTLARIA